MLRHHNAIRPMHTIPLPPPQRFLQRKHMGVIRPFEFLPPRAEDAFTTVHTSLSRRSRTKHHHAQFALAHAESTLRFIRPRARERILRALTPTLISTHEHHIDRNPIPLGTPKSLPVLWRLTLPRGILELFSGVLRLSLVDSDKYLQTAPTTPPMPSGVLQSELEGDMTKGLSVAGL